MISTVQEGLNIAKIVRDIGVPNYKQARFPLKSGLISDEKKDLCNYPDKQLLQYLSFGFPLSFTNPGSLTNVDITKHYLDLQHPQALDDYLAKET